MADFKDQAPLHFLMDSDCRIFQVSEKVARMHRDLHPKSTEIVSRVDAEANTIWFTPPVRARVTKEA